MDRTSEMERLYQGLALVVRRSRELSPELHGGLSLVDYTLLSEVQARAGARAADLAALYGLDKSTLSRQVNQLVSGGMLERLGERSGQRGVVLNVTPSGAAALVVAANAIRRALLGWLEDWEESEISAFADLLDRLNDRIASDIGLTRGGVGAPAPDYQVTLQG